MGVPLVPPAAGGLRQSGPVPQDAGPVAPGVVTGTVVAPPAERAGMVGPAAPRPVPPRPVPTTPLPVPAPRPVPPPLPVPAPLPDPGEQVPLVEVGRIRIPRIGVDEVVREGVQQMVIDAGVAHWPGTPLAGGWGNGVLAGHRSSHTAPFLRLGELIPGDVIEWTGPGGVHRYRVTGSEVVGADALWIVDQHPGHHLTIFTCHPIGSSAQRLVVRAELEGTPGS